MLHKPYVKYLLLFIVVTMGFIVIKERKNVFNFPIKYRGEVEVDKDLTSEEYIIYVANKDNVILPLNVEVKHNKSYSLKGYEDKNLRGEAEKIYYTFSLLTNNSNHLPLGVKTLLPRSTKLIDYELNDEYLTLNLTKDFKNYNTNNEYEMLSLIVHSFHNNFGVKYIKILVEGNNMKYKDYQYVWLKVADFPLNPVGKGKTDNSYMVYFYLDIDNSLYLTPVTIYENIINIKEQINQKIKNNISLPVITSIYNSKQAEIQYYLSLQVNNLIKECNYDLFEINTIEVNLY